jgi:hypothetical protein
VVRRPLTFPFLEIEAPTLEIRMDWTLEQFLGYIETWSAILAMQKAAGFVAPSGNAARAKKLPASGGTTTTLSQFPTPSETARLAKA